MEQNTNLDNYEKNNSLNYELEEKIDYIYKTLKSQKRNSRIWFLIKIIIFFTIFYSIYIYIPQLSQDKIDSMKEKLIWTISSFVGPIAKDMATDMMKDINSDMIKNINVDEIKNINNLPNTENIDLEKINDLIKNNPEILEMLKK